MSDNSANNKRIAKNTLFLYMRMILILIIKLYTSRIILNILGVTDYGIYNLVAGIIVLFSFLNSAMNGASQRFFNIAMGKKDEILLKKYFINSFNAHILIGVFSILFAESIGLFILNKYLNIPPERFNAALFAYHIAIGTSFLNIIRTPFNAIILAHEKMSFYAYTSILEVALSLGVVFILPLLPFDQLKTYSILIAIVTIILLLIYFIYCTKKYTETRLHLSYSKETIKEIFSFSIWSTLSSFANIASRQGLNMILNIFNGVTINAATGIMTQVSTAIYSFIQNFLVAVNPQLIKNYASNDWEYLKKLFYSSSKFAYYLMFLLSLPIILCMDEILKLWLVNVPTHTAIFCILSLAALQLNTLGGPIWTTIQASGKIQKYQIFIFISTLLNIPIYYILQKIGLEPEYCLILPIITNLLVVIYGLHICILQISIKAFEYFQKVTIPIIVTTIIGSIVPVIATIFLESQLSDILFICIICFISIVSTSLTIIICGLNSSEKKLIIQFITKKKRL